MKKNKRKLIYLLILCFSTLILVQNYIGIVRVNGDSMEPNLSNHEIYLSNKKDDNYKRFDIVYFKKAESIYIKRIVGLPNEYLEYKNNTLYINNKIVIENFEHGFTSDYSIKGGDSTTIPSNSYFVLGDNRTDSLDSRGFGYIRKEEIIGKIIGVNP